MELPRVDGHLVVGRTAEEARTGRPAKDPTEFRREAIELVGRSGRPVAEVARPLDIAEGTLNCAHSAHTTTWTSAYHWPSTATRDAETPR